MEDRATKFRKFIEQLPRLCSPTICGTLSQPTTKAERNNRTPTFEWSLEQKAILSPANITTATCSDVGEVDHSFLHQESEQFFSQKCIAPSPMTTPSTRPYSRSQPARKNWNNHMFDERDENTSDEDEEQEDEDEDREEEEEEEEEFRTQDCSMMSATSNLNDSNPVRTQAPRISSRRRTSRRRDSDTDIDMDVLDEQTDIETDSDKDSDHDDDTDQDDMTDVENNNPDNDNKSDDDDDDDDDDDERDDGDNNGAKGDRDMDSLFLSPPMRSSQSQQRFDIFSPQAFDRAMDDENTLQSTPKTTSSQIFRPRARRMSDMSD